MLLRQYIELQSLLQEIENWLHDEEGDMVERGLILAAIVVAAVFIWFSIGSSLADNLATVEAVIP